jgi:hypothetical protein
MSQAQIYNETQAKKANLTLERLGLSGWGEDDVKKLQTKIGVSPADGWLGPQSIEAWKTWAKANDSKPTEMKLETVPGYVIVAGKSYQPPLGVTVVNFAEKGGIPAQLDDTNERKHPVFQFVIHRGAESRMKGENFAQATERILDARGLSTTFSMDIDGRIYQHFDPAVRRGRHATHHNVQSDSIDIGGPFDTKTFKAEPGQTITTFQAAIGRENDNKPPMSRGYAPVKCYTMTPAQVFALAEFLPWYCQLRGIPATACEDWRTFRLGGAGVQDPVTNVKGIFAHGHISGPGQRVDGFMELSMLKQAGAKIIWRSGANFFNT